MPLRKEGSQTQVGQFVDWLQKTYREGEIIDIRKGSIPVPAGINRHKASRLAYALVAMGMLLRRIKTPGQARVTEALATTPLEEIVGRLRSRATTAEQRRRTAKCGGGEQIQPQRGISISEELKAALEENERLHTAVQDLREELARYGRLKEWLHEKYQQGRAREELERVLASSTPTNGGSSRRRSAGMIHHGRAPTQFHAPNLPARLQGK